MSKKTLFFILLGGLTLPFAASAQVTLAGMAAAVAGQVIIIATWIVVIMWVVTGILFLTAQGDPGKLNAGKLALLGAIGGTFLIIIAHVAVALVSNSFGIPVQ